MKRFTDFTPEQTADIVQLYEQGVSAYRLAETYRCNSSRIVRVLRRQDITIRNRRQAAKTRTGNAEDDHCYLPTLAEIEAAKREMLERDIQQKRESNTPYSPDYCPRVYRFNPRSGYTPGSL